jgi:hypothetical protein
MTQPSLLIVCSHDLPRGIAAGSGARLLMPASFGHDGSDASLRRAEGVYTPAAMLAAARAAADEHERVVVHDIALARSLAEMVKPGRLILSVPPGAALADLAPFAYSAIGRRFRRIVTHQPVHHVYTIERLRFPPSMVELVPPCAEVVAEGGGARDPDQVVVPGFSGMDTRILAASGIARDARVELLVTGDAPMVPGLSSRRVGDAELSTALARAAVVVVAVADRESGAGAEAIVRAMMAGAPLVYTNAFGVEHLVVEDQEGLAVRVGDAAGLRDAVRRLLGDNELAARLGATARRKAMTTYSPLHWGARMARIAAAGSDEGPQFYLIPAHGRAPAEADG